MLKSLFLKLLALFGVFSLASPPVAAAEIINLPVPHLWEIPDGVWTPPWSGACEEASLIMVEQYYLGTKSLAFDPATAKKLISPLFPIETRLFGSNLDTDSARTIKLINDYTSFDAELKNNPTAEEIKNELRAGRPVISLHRGYDLRNPLHRFRRGGSSYHMMAINGFDEDKKEFLVNDPELKNGLDFRYNYDIILASLHDFNHTAKKASGPPVALFTKPKTIVKTAASGRIYLVRDNARYHLASPAVFANHRWSWSLVKTADAEWLASLSQGKTIAD